eukprot:3933726-Rhodomonas_salina.1
MLPLPGNAGALHRVNVEDTPRPVSESAAPTRHPIAPPMKFRPTTLITVFSVRKPADGHARAVRILVRIPSNSQADHSRLGVSRKSATKNRRGHNTR